MSELEFFTYKKNNDNYNNNMKKVSWFQIIIYHYWNCVDILFLKEINKQKLVYQQASAAATIGWDVPPPSHDARHGWEEAPGPPCEWGQRGGREEEEKEEEEEVWWIRYRQKLEYKLLKCDQYLLSRLLEYTRPVNSKSVCWFRTYWLSFFRVKICFLF